jgi:hypothetical protein
MVEQQDQASRQRVTAYVPDSLPFCDLQRALTRVSSICWRTGTGWTAPGGWPDPLERRRTLLSSSSHWGPSTFKRPFKTLLAIRCYLFGNRSSDQGVPMLVADVVIGRLPCVKVRYASCFPFHRGLYTWRVGRNWQLPADSRSSGQLDPWYTGHRRQSLSFTGPRHWSDRLSGGSLGCGV